MNAIGALIVGYGNVLRGDDGVGCRVAELLDDDPRFAGARVLARHQLTPELAVDVEAARLVVLIDARMPDAVLGDVRVQAVDPSQPRVATGSHAVDAGDLVELAQQLYGRVPPVMIVSVAAERFELGEGLSPAVAAAVPRVIDAVVGLVDQETGRLTTPTSSCARLRRRVDRHGGRYPRQLDDDGDCLNGDLERQM